MTETKKEEKARLPCSADRRQALKSLRSWQVLYDESHFSVVNPSVELGDGGIAGVAELVVAPLLNLPLTTELGPGVGATL